MGGASGTSVGAPSRLAFVVNPIKPVDLDRLHRRAGLEAAGRGAGRPLWFETTESDPGAGMARRAVEAGADMVVACGGDGTVNAVASAVAGTDVTLGIVPMGTGNLLAHNFGIPSDTEEALAVLDRGVDRRVDTGTLAGRRFLGLAGTGLDATMVKDASSTAKRRLGWIAYVPPLVRSLRDERFTVTITSDGEEHRWQRCLSVLVGNVGDVHAGVTVLPAAVPDDGILDVAVIAPSRPSQWVTTAARLATGSASDGGGITRLRGTRFDIELDAARPLEVDGEVFDESASFTIELDPGSLVLRVPR